MMRTELSRETCKSRPRQGLRGVRYFVLDEADRLLDMGFLPQIREVVQLMGSQPQQRQNLMFSATWPPVVRSLAREFMCEAPVRLSVDQGDTDDLCVNKSVTQIVEIIREAKKEARLLELLHDDVNGKSLIFVNTKKGCAALAMRLRKVGVQCGEIHGNLNQEDRNAALAAFINGSTRCLVATDLAARGIDVMDISLVVCYDFPDSMLGGLDDYVHRVGRTGRAGRLGRAVTFFPAPEDVSGTRSAGNAHELIKILRGAGQLVPADLEALDRGATAVNGKGKRKISRATGVQSGDDPPKKFRRVGDSVRVEGMADGGVHRPVLHFENVGFRCEIVGELRSKGFKEPTPIQAHAWPLIMSGHDCICIAKTGSGKTLAFLLPALHFMSAWMREHEASQAVTDSIGAGPLALVIAPTRELAVQIHRESERFVQAVGSRAVCLYGGEAWESQAAVLEAGVELVIATPGRLAFLIGRGGEDAAAVMRTIASLGAQKQLAGAIAAFREFLAHGGAPTRRIFSALLNAHVVCGSMDGAAKVRGEMEEKGFALGVVEYTTLLKGELAVGDIVGAQKVVADMEARCPPVLPDQRTVNTYLRGCLKLGEVQTAVDFHARLGEWGIRPDSTTYKIMLQVLCQGLRLKAMRRMLKELGPRASGQHEDASEGHDGEVCLHLYTARVACLLGRRCAASRALGLAEAALSRVSLANSREFDQHRQQELAREASSLRQALREEEDEATESSGLVGALGRTFAFPALIVPGAEIRQAEGASNSLGDTSAPVFESLRRSFGLEECFGRGLCTEEAFERRLRRCFRRNGMLRWHRVFRTRGLPTKLEVCAGTGDWAVAQALAEAGRANWVASELRFDRVHSILTKIVLARVENLALLAGDACYSLRKRIPPGSLANVCINFPEPPHTVRNATCDDAESQLHLLTPTFFRDLHIALEATGVLTILSDNQQYMRSIARTLGNLRGDDRARLFVPFGDVPDQHVMEAEELCGMLVYEGTPGPAVGHAAAVSSYFDRFFQHGQHTERYYMAVAKS